MITETKRLLLDRPTSKDVADLHLICSDPRVWAHFPSLRHTDIEQTRVMLDRWILSWDRDGLGTWMVRQPGSQTILGYGGCSIKQDIFWNLGYRFAYDSQGQGFATELSLEAVRQAKASRPDLPIVAYLLEHNLVSARVAEKVGLALVHQGIDAGNPDPTAIRLVYADRQLGAEELSEVMQ
ncbi:GCN5 family acetyltransferase (plasmid) [Arthrobacter alpinus]|uniref:GNAT family N-acetyltransferase n=1 Tax=Arthrobacter alpinus TaxID=656366 RepID=UPI0005C9231C|nr:GNAT family N-acetyltransferase [Arthrobacter alpinus]ALV47886.1 GCN5 family acetyltransferase [Arthrobacter alpinus]